MYYLLNIRHTDSLFEFFIDTWKWIMCMCVCGGGGGEGGGLKMHVQLEMVKK